MSQEWLKWCWDTTTTPPPLNSTWLFGFRKCSCQTLGWWGGGGICIRPPPLNSTWRFGLKKIFLSNFGVVRWWWYMHQTTTHPNFGSGKHLTSPPPHIRQTAKKNFLVGLGISSNFLQLLAQVNILNFPPPHWPNSEKKNLTAVYDMETFSMVVLSGEYVMIYCWPLGVPTRLCLGVIIFVS